ncbi:MAG TPA: sigma-54-dependent Fis family transcriptional regulator [Acidobacterium sp.]|uniref:Sigma-54 dependent DNA-binding response regulator n=2 Tax=Acidobacteriaceae TaxID=204434 RepID=C1F980_ACIC5|nr:sigma-54 dependent DNA-binding response regulator [Acidobacterium capsulatum ATCC 51196]HCT61603.1 sigma-54-dependent Fis family transcriptional regulator [Acidobacterium sp.]
MPRTPQPRTAVLASADLSFRTRVREALTGLRWEVQEAQGGAEALAYLEARPCEAMIVDTWLPDLEIQEFLAECEKRHPQTDLIAVDDPGPERGPERTQARSPRRNEVLLALRRGQDADHEPQGDGASWNGMPEMTPVHDRTVVREEIFVRGTAVVEATRPGAEPGPGTVRLPELIGEAPAMLEVSRRIRLVAPRAATVLVQGPTGSGKELVARAIHRLSPRANRRLVALNCAAIPDTLLEAELFGHTRGAFTGAVQGRIGRIEAADGGTLFLDEIGEMPLALQAKLLRFLETGEVQRIGDNDPIRVDVRIVAATHRSLAEMVKAGSFRADLYYRLAVFLIRTPGLGERPEDLPLLVERLLARMAEQAPVRRLSAEAMERLRQHAWPGNVRELQHVLERAAILAAESPEIGAAEIEFGETF